MRDFESYLMQLKEQLNDIDVNIIIIVKHAMEIVELTELKGEEQKNMAIKLIKSFTKDLDDIKILIDDETLSSTIDLIVDATKGKLNINLKKKLKRFCCL